jgi:hypothetical protein
MILLLSLIQVFVLVQNPENISGRLYCVDMKNSELIIRQYQPTRKVLRVKVDNKTALDMYNKVHEWQDSGAIVFIYGAYSDGTINYRVNER